MALICCRSGAIPSTNIFFPKLFVKKNNFLGSFYKVPMTTNKLTHPIASATLQQFSSSWHEESEDPVDNEKSSIVDISM
jgi:hypothetical protein